jgi:hypothetical protein
VNPIGAPKIWKPKSKIWKPRGSDIKWSNPWGDQATHFVGYTKRLYAKNSSYNHKNAKKTFDVQPTICVSSTEEEKTQIRWAATKKDMSMQQT